MQSTDVNEKPRRGKKRTSRKRNENGEGAIDKRNVVRHSRHVCCLAQQTCLLRHTADMSAAQQSGQSFCVTQKTCLPCDTAHICCVSQQACLLWDTADMSSMQHQTLFVASHSRHVCCVTQQTRRLLHSRHVCCVTQQKMSAVSHGRHCLLCCTAHKA